MEPQHAKRKMAAILAADVAGYSRMTEADEEGTHARLKAHQSELIDPKIQEHDGRIVKSTGDGVLVEFPSVVEAVRCAIEVQNGMAERDANTPKHQRIEFRVGINLGDVIVDKEDIYGDGVNIAARLENLARPGSIYISGTAFDHVQNKITLPCKFLGKQRVRNIKEPVRVYRVRLDRRRTAATRQSRRNRLVAGVAVLAVIGVAGAFYMQHRASITETGSMSSAPQPVVQAATAPPETPKDLPPLDAQVWDAIKNSTNPADYEAYLRLFPTGAVADLARQRLWVLTPASPPPASTTEPIPVAPKPKPQQQAAMNKTAPSPSPTHEPSTTSNAPAANTPAAAPQQRAEATNTVPSRTPDREGQAAASASTSTTPTPTPLQQASAPAPTSPAPTAAPQQQALNAPDVSKSATSSPSANAPYDGEWKGFTPGMGDCTSCYGGGNVIATVANNTVFGKFENRGVGHASFSGKIASDGSFTGTLGDRAVSGKFDKDRFQAIISTRPTDVGGGQVIFLERVK